MNTRRVLLIPGSTSPVLTRDYREVYEDLADEAAARGFQVQLVVFPGQGVNDGERLTFAGSLESTLQAGSEFKPHWVIARSYGCLVAVAAADSDAEWVRNCERMVLWGPCTGRTTQRRWGTEEKEAETIAKYEEFGTRLAQGFYTRMPAIEDRIRHARCALRIVRGEWDEYNTWEDVLELQTLHEEAHPGIPCERIAITGLEHHVVRRGTPPEKWVEYCDRLFNPVLDPVSISKPQ